MTKDDNLLKINNLKRDFIQNIRTTKESPYYRKVLSFFERLGLEERSLDKLSNNFSYNDLINFFSSFNEVSRTYFFFRKKTLKDFYTLLEDNNIQTPLKELEKITFGSLNKDGIFSKFYFSDINHLYESFISDFEVVSSIHGIDFNKYIDCLCLLLLVFRGLTFEEIVQIKKSDVLEDGVRYNNKMLYMPSNLLDLIKKYRDAEFFYESFSTNANYFFKTDYLFRTSLGNYTMPYFVNKLINFNRMCLGDKEYVYSHCLRSGLYNSAYRYERQNGIVKTHDHETWIKLLSITRTQTLAVRKDISKFLPMYFDYVNYFFPEEKGKYGKESAR